MATFTVKYKDPEKVVADTTQVIGVFKMEVNEAGDLLFHDNSTNRRVIRAFAAGHWLEARKLIPV